VKRSSLYCVCSGRAIRESGESGPDLLHDSMSYISALHGKKLYNDDCNLVDCVISACRELFDTLPLKMPKHMYSHLSGTFLDELLELADITAKGWAYKARPSPGWIRGLQEQCAVVTRPFSLGDDEGEVDRQTHHVRRKLTHDLSNWFNLRRGAGAIPERVPKVYALYSAVIEGTNFSIGDHLVVLGVRHGLHAPDPNHGCPFCGGDRDHRDDLLECPLGGWYWAEHHYDLARRIPLFYFQWRFCVPSELGVLVLHKFGHFLIRVSSVGEALSTSAYFGTGTCFPVASVGHSGDVDESCVSFLKKKGATSDILVHLVRGVVQNTAWLHRRGRANALPVLPLIKCVFNGDQYDLLTLLDDRLPHVKWGEGGTEDSPCRRWPDIFTLRWLAAMGICGTVYVVHHPRKLRLRWRLDLPCPAIASADGHPIRWPTPKIFLCDSQDKPAPGDVLGCRLLWVLQFMGHGTNRCWSCWCPLPTTAGNAQFCFGLRAIWSQMLGLLGFEVSRVYTYLLAAGFAGR
jgi:hypothetical protein